MTPTRPLGTLAVVGFTWLAVAAGAAAQDPESKRVAPYLGTPMDVVNEMLRVAKVGPTDYVVDLGSGDGRLVITAVKDYGAHGGFGVDINRDFVAYANAKASEQGVADRAQFHAKDLFETDISRATVVTVYLLPAIMGRVSAKLRAELAPGTRVVSHDFPFPDWMPDRVSTVSSPEKLNYTGRADAVVLLYTVPERGKAR